MMNDSYLYRKYRECEQLRAENRFLSTWLTVQSLGFTAMIICLWIWG